MQHCEESTSTSFLLEGVQRLLQSPERSTPKPNAALSITEDIHEFRKLQQELRARGSFTMTSANLYMHEAIESQLKDMRSRAALNAKSSEGIIKTVSSPPSSPATRRNSLLSSFTPSSPVTRRNSLLTHRKSMSDSDSFVLKDAVKSPSSPKQHSPSPHRTSSPKNKSPSSHRTSLSMDSNRRDNILSQLQASITETAAASPTRTKTPFQINNISMTPTKNDSPWKKNTQLQKTSLHFTSASRNNSSSNVSRSPTTKRSGSNFSVTIKERGDKQGTQIFQLGMQ